MSMTVTGALAAECNRLRARVDELERQLAERDAAMVAQARQLAGDRQTAADWERG